jgi:hypothetical protein
MDGVLRDSWLRAENNLLHVECSTETLRRENSLLYRSKQKMCFVFLKQGSQQIFKNRQSKLIKVWRIVVDLQKNPSHETIPFLS